MSQKRPPFLKRILEKLGFMDLFDKWVAVRSAPGSTHIECTNCSLVNPSAWERCERCNAPLHTKKETIEDIEPPSLVEEI